MVRTLSHSFSSSKPGIAISFSLLSLSSSTKGASAAKPELDVKATAPKAPFERKNRRDTDHAEEDVTDRIQARTAALLIKQISTF